MRVVEEVVGLGVCNNVVRGILEKLIERFPSSGIVKPLNLEIEAGPKVPFVVGGWHGSLVCHDFAKTVGLGWRR